MGSLKLLATGAFLAGMALSHGTALAQTNVTFWQNAILPGCGEEGVFAVCSMSTSMGVPTTTCNNINGGARVNRCF